LNQIKIPDNILDIPGLKTGEEIRMTSEIVVLGNPYD